MRHQTRCVGSNGSRPPLLVLLGNDISEEFVSSRKQKEGDWHGQAITWWSRK